jgi:hypothetical protein
MKRDSRIKILQKLAKKDKDPLRGPQSRRNIEKRLAKAKQIYDQTSKDLKVINANIASLQEKKELLESQQSTAKTDVGFCHRLIQTMDFAGSTEAKIGADREDVAYNVDGQWCSYNDDEGVIPYKKPSKATEPEPPTEPPTDAEDEEDFLDLSEGIDITI